MAALTKAQMADRLFDELGLNKREAKEIVEMFFGELRDALERNEQVKLSGFGNFDLREKSERPDGDMSLRGVARRRLHGVMCGVGIEAGQVGFRLRVRRVP
ncbi:MAG: HU family DNA-binding protein, partial [Pseudomonadota bacterium]